MFGLSVAYVPTGSMEPVIHKGDYVMFGATSFDDVKEDDIIVYYNPTEKKCIIHRVNKIVTTGDEKYLVAKGDANVAIDNAGMIVFFMYYSPYVIYILSHYFILFVLFSKVFHKNYLKY